MPRRRLEAGGRDGIAETRHQERHCVLVCCGKDTFSDSYQLWALAPSPEPLQALTSGLAAHLLPLPFCFAWNRDPVILPFFHSNMGSVLPVDSVVPRVGKKVTVTIGKPGKMPMMNFAVIWAAYRALLTEVFYFPVCPVAQASRWTYQM